MAQSIEEFLLEAIEKDDIKAFEALMEQRPCGSFRLGRFPVLSMLYLYKSRKIISAYEEKFIKITSWEALKEPTSVAKLFSEKAGKCLRLYLNEVVSPLEMLLILDNVKRLKRVYPLAKPSFSVKDRLQTIYSVKYSLNIKFEENDIIFDRRPLSGREKKKIATICLCSFLAVAIAVAAPVTTVSLIPKRAEGEVTKLKHINFAEKTTYTLKNDLTIPEDFSVEEMNCTIEGNGNKLIFENGATLGRLSGKIKGVEMQTSGGPIFSEISEKAELSGVTVNVTADIQTYESTAFVALTNYGTIDGVTVNIGGNLSVHEGDSEVIIGGMVLNNLVKITTGTQYFGTVKNCTVNYLDFTLDGEVHSNTAFGGIVGINRGVVLDSTVTGSITSDTVDLAGICSVNNYGVSGAVNEATLTQTSESDGWNPVVAGIAIENYNLIEYSENRGNLYAKSSCGEVETQPEVSVSGIAHINRGGIMYLGGLPYNVGIQFCKNSGAITAEGGGAAYVGGIAAHAYNQISYCLTSGNITVNADTVYAGGIYGRSDLVGADILSVTWGYAAYCISESKLDVTATGEHSAVGGIAGFVSQGNVVDGFGTTVGHFGGGVNNCIFTGSCEREITHFGNIAGVSGKNILYGTDIYIYFIEYINFSENYHINNSLPSYGAAATAREDEEEEKEKEEYDYEPVDGKDESALSKEEIEQLELYGQILEKLNR